MVGAGGLGSHIAPTLVRKGETFRLALKVDDKWGNPSNLVDCEVRLHCEEKIDELPRSVRLRPGSFGAVLQGLRFQELGEAFVRVLSEDGEELCRSNAVRTVTPDAPLVHFWGDTHGQSNETLGTNTAREYFEFGRDKDQWQIVKPKPLRADGLQVEELIRKLKDAKLDLTVSEEDAKKAASAFASGTAFRVSRATNQTQLAPRSD